MLEMEKFNINELAGATGLILGAVSGILVVIFKSRCYCKFRVGFNDNCSLCMCERKPPPDNNNDSDDENNKKDETKPINKKSVKKPVNRNSFELEPEPEPEQIIPNKKNVDNLV